MARRRGNTVALQGSGGAGPRGTINSFFLQPRERDSQLELPEALLLCPLLASKGVMFVQVPPQGSHIILGRPRGSFGKFFI